MENFEQKRVYSEEEKAEWRRENAEMIKQSLPSFEIAPDGTLMRHNDKGELDEDQLTSKIEGRN